MAATNEARARRNMPQLVWDAALEAEAQASRHAAYIGRDNKIWMHKRRLILCS